MVTGFESAKARELGARRKLREGAEGWVEERRSNIGLDWRGGNTLVRAQNYSFYRIRHRDKVRS